MSKTSPFVKVANRTQSVVVEKICGPLHSFSKIQKQISAVQIGYLSAGAFTMAFVRYIRHIPHLDVALQYVFYDVVGKYQAIGLRNIGCC